MKTKGGSWFTWASRAGKRRPTTTASAFAPATRCGPAFRRSGRVPADITVLGDTMQWINAEFAAVQGPWTLQAEWLVSYHAGRPAAGRRRRRRRADGRSLFYQGGYVQLLYFLTGESDNYSLERMAFDRVKPFENFFLGAGRRRLQLLWPRGLAGRRPLQLPRPERPGDQRRPAAQLDAGLNWFFNPNTKWQFNYIATYRDVSQTADFPDGSGWIHGWGMRFAQDF